MNRHIGCDTLAVGRLRSAPVTVAPLSFDNPLWVFIPHGENHNGLVNLDSQSAAVLLEPIALGGGRRCLIRLGIGVGCDPDERAAKGDSYHVA